MRDDELIRLLDLAPHPEGGFYREVYRSALDVLPADGRSPRQALTTIYFLLRAGERSRWHRVRSDEVWHLYEGGPVELFLAPPDLDGVRNHTLGPAGESDGPTATVPAGWWQAARTSSAFVLAGCTVAPGFSFDDFSFLRDEPDLVVRLAGLEPGLIDLV
jgi:predicted cupin superfamily sugar epimerase